MLLRESLVTPNVIMCDVNINRQTKTPVRHNIFPCTARWTWNAGLTWMNVCAEHDEFVYSYAKPENERAPDTMRIQEMLAQPDSWMDTHRNTLARFLMNLALKLQPGSTTPVPIPDPAVRKVRES